MSRQWFALSVLMVLVAFTAGAQAGARNASGDPGASAANAGVAHDFSAKAKKYAKKQTDTYNRTKKYR